MTERDDRVREEGFKAAVQFAMRASSSTGQVPIEVIEDAIAYGESLVQPGIGLDDALEMEHGLAALRALLVYRRCLEDRGYLNKITAIGGQDADGDTGEVEAERELDAGPGQEGAD
jgi:hypothetical protein